MGTWSAMVVNESVNRERRLSTLTETSSMGDDHLPTGWVHVTMMALCAIMIWCWCTCHTRL